MLTVTQRAKQELKKTLQDHTDDPEIGLRLVSERRGQWGFVLDREAQGDQVVEHKGSKVLLVGHELAPQLNGITLDLRDTVDGRQLVLLKQ